MKFLIVTHSIHKYNLGSYYAYEPYVREMNLWCDKVNDVRIIAPISKEKPTSIDEKYKKEKISFSIIPSFNIIGLKNKIKTLIVLPIIVFRIFKAMLWADHIHLRCPGNIGLIGVFVQILFPFKKKTVKYAGNWDPNSHQPFSYKLQKKILSNTFFTRKCKVLVYGDWKNQTKNILSFFTASYFNSDVIQIEKKSLDSLIKFIYVGAFSKGKQPLLTVKVIEELSKNYNVQLDMFGNGELFKKVSTYISNKELNNYVNLHGNQSKNIVKEAYKKSHFLIFISKSEGWPKVVAEAMFWKSLPISSNVSCVKYMLGNGERGSLVSSKSSYKDIANIVENYIKNENLYHQKVIEAQKWSQKFTLEKFESEIEKIINN